MNNNGDLSSLALLDHDNLRTNGDFRGTDFDHKEDDKQKGDRPNSLQSSAKISNKIYVTSSENNGDQIVQKDKKKIKSKKKSVSIIDNKPINTLKESKT